MKTQKILTVSELTRDIKEVIENVFCEVFVEGEISNLRQPSSGHVYFSLKDEQAQLRAVLFKNASVRIKFALADGMKAVCQGRVGVYERDGQYQLYVNDITPKGQGALQLAFEGLKDRLSKEGLFDEARKRPIPFLPQAIGVVTSLTGAVIQDILNVLYRRFPAAHVVICPARVQGPGAAEEIAAAIKDLNELKLKELKTMGVIILARGGGSLEDLWCFNEESVARAIFNSALPVISAVGHQTDYTIADFVADRRAPTPSAAAEIVMPSRLELDERIENFLTHLWRNLMDFVPEHAQRIDGLIEQATRALRQRVRAEEMRFSSVLNEMDALSPLAVLKRGYSVTTALDNDKCVFSANSLKKGELVKTRLSKGAFISEITQIVV